MNKKKIFTALSAVLLAIVMVVFGFLNEVPYLKAGAAYQQQQFRYLKNDAYGFGERLDYKVKYGFVVAGDGFFHIQSKPIIRANRECFDIRFQVSSLKSLEWLYKVTDQYRTAMDVSGLFPWEFVQIIREGKYKKDYKASFDQANNTAYADNRKFKIPSYTYDIVSAFFYVRTLNLSSMKKDSTFYMQNFFDNEVNKLGVRILGREIVETEAGKFRCIVIEPIILKGGLFKSEANIYIYLTDDERKIPVKVATKIIIGYVSAELVSYRGTRGPIRAKIN